MPPRDQKRSEVRDVGTPVPPNSARLTAWSAAAATGGTVRFAREHGRDGAATRGITSDSRAVFPGCAFVALRGDRYDGHDYVGAAIQGGAALVVVEKGRFDRAPGSP